MIVLSKLKERELANLRMLLVTYKSTSLTCALVFICPLNRFNDGLIYTVKYGCDILGVGI